MPKIMNSHDLNSITEVVNQSNKVLIETTERPTIDGLAALLALGAALRNQGKDVTLACAADLPSEVSELKGSDQIIKELKPTNLVISFDYVDGMVEKVSYNVEGDRFSLVLSGKEATIDPSQIAFSQNSGDFDLIIILDTPKLSYLGKLLEVEKKLHDQVSVLNIDRHANNELFGTYNLVVENTVSTSELVLDIIQGLGMPLNEEIADLVLKGLKAATNNFSANLKAELMEKAALCLRFLGQVEGEQIKKTGEAPDESWFAPKIYRSSKIIE